MMQRIGATIAALLLMVGVVGANGCGHSKGTGGTGGKGGAAGSATGQAGAGGGAAGADAGPDGASDAANDAGPPEAGIDADGGMDASDASPEASSDSASDVAVETAPPYDAGADCVAPTGESPLSAATAGIPATGLALWLRADRGVYKTPGDAVCAWADQSGHAWILTNVATRPAWASTGLGGQPAVHFTDGSQVMVTGGVLALAPTSARTIVAVSTLVATTKRFQPFYQGQAASPGTYLGLDANTFNTAGGREGVYCMNNAYDSALATAPTPRVHVYTLATMTPGTPVLAAIDYRVNGATQTLARTSGGLGSGNFEDFSAANVSAVGGGAEAFIAEVIVYDRALTVPERMTIEAALQVRYGIP